MFDSADLVDQTRVSVKMRTPTIDKGCQLPTTAADISESVTQNATSK